MADRVLCPYCFGTYYPHECAIVSELDGSILKAPPKGLAKLRQQFGEPLPLGGDLYDKRPRYQCPGCARNWPEGIELAENHIIAVIGGTGAGVHTYLAVAIDQLLNNKRIQQAIGVLRIKAASAKVERYHLSHHEALIKQQEVLAATPPAAMMGGPADPLIYCIEFPHNARKPVYLYFYPAANEDMVLEANSLEYARFMFHASGIIMMADPYAMPNMRKYIHPQFYPPVLPITSPSEILLQVIHLYETRLRAKLNIPIAVTISKSDMVQFADPQRRSSLFATPSYLNPQLSSRIQRQDLEAVREHVRKLLELYGDADLVSLSEMYEQVGYFAVAATGWPPDFRIQQYPDIDPIRVLDPLLWILWKLGVIEAEEGKAEQK
jgi:hypothetical protein